VVNTTISVSITIEASGEAIFAVLADPRNTPLLTEQAGWVVPSTAKP